MWVIMCPTIIYMRYGTLVLTKVEPIKIYGKYHNLLKIIITTKHAQIRSLIKSQSNRPTFTSVNFCRDIILCKRIGRTHNNYITRSDRLCYTYMVFYLEFSLNYGFAQQGDVYRSYNY